jgi:hypothetical protein
LKFQKGRGGGLGRVSVIGWMSFVLKEKLKGFKGVIKEWNKVEYEKLEDRVVLLLEETAELDVRGGREFNTCGCGGEQN